MAEKGGTKNEKSNIERFVILILFLLIGLPLILIMIYIVLHLNAYFIIGIFFIILISIILIMGIQQFMIKIMLNKATRSTIQQLINNIKKRNYGIITAKIKKIYLTKEEIANRGTSGTIVGASSVGGLGSGYIITHFRDYLIDDGTRTIKLINAPAYPRYSKHQQITFLGKIKKNHDNYYLKWLRTLPDNFQL